MNVQEESNELEEKESVCEGIKRWINGNVMQIG